MFTFQVLPRQKYQRSHAVNNQNIYSEDYFIMSGMANGRYPNSEKVSQRTPVHWTSSSPRSSIFEEWCRRWLGLTSQLLSIEFECCQQKTINALNEIGKVCNRERRIPLNWPKTTRSKEWLPFRQCFPSPSKGTFTT